MQQWEAYGETHPVPDATAGSGATPKPPAVVVQEKGWFDSLSGWWDEKWENFKKYVGDSAEAQGRGSIQSRPPSVQTQTKREVAEVLADRDPTLAGTARRQAEQSDVAAHARDTAGDVSRAAGEGAVDATRLAVETEGGGKLLGGAAGAVKGLGRGAKRTLAAETQAAKTAEDAIAAEVKAGRAAAKKDGPGTFVAKRETKSAEAQAYEEAVADARPGEAYRVPYRNPKPRGRPQVDFDGVQRGAPVDAKVSIVTREKTVDQAVRQAEALRQNGAKGLWKVPTEAEARRARQMLERANATDTIFIVVERPIK